MSKAITFANREVCNLTICDFATQRPIHVISYANATTQEVTGEQVFAFGGQGHAKRVQFYGEKGGSLQVSTQIMSSELFSMMTGAEVETSAKFIKRLELKATESKLTIPEGVSLAAGSLNVYAAADDCGTPLEVTVAENIITLPTGHTTGDYVVYGIESIASGVKKMSVKSTTFPKAVTIYGETLMKGEDGITYPYKMIVYKAAPEQTFSFGFSNSGDPAELTLNFELLADQDDNMLDMLLLEEAAAQEEAAEQED